MWRDKSTNGGRRGAELSIGRGAEHGVERDISIVVTILWRRAQRNAA